MELQSTKYTCFCCGWDQLETAPYERVPAQPVDTRDLSPPYQRYWGGPSYGMCPCCGFEFGTDDDEIGGNPGDSFETARRRWLEEEGACWVDEDLKPKNWDLKQQLAKLIT